MKANMPTFLILFSLLGADQIDPAEVAFFEKKIRPVLVEHCYRCHSVQAKMPKAGLHLDSRAGIRRGGESGPAIVPGKIDESLLIQALRHEELEMPPDRKLPDRVIADFVAWVRNGAPDPRDHPTVRKAEGSWAAILAQRRTIWTMPVYSLRHRPTVTR